MAAQHDEWVLYKRLVDRPYYVSRWMLTQTRELLSASALAGVLDETLASAPLPKPADHLGDAATDMLSLVLARAEVAAVLEAVRAARREGRTTTGTADRGLGGFEESWQECLAWYDATGGGGASARLVDSLVQAFNANDMEAVLAHFSADAVYHNVPREPVRGIEAIRAALESFPGRATQVDRRLRHIVANDAGVVLTERVDRFRIGEQWVEVAAMGTFEVRGGLIVAWRDYFDPQHLQSQPAR